MRKWIIIILVLAIFLQSGIQGVKGQELVFGDLSFNVVGDTQAPVITIESPENITYAVNTTDYNITVNEELNTALVSIDGGANMSMDNDSITHYFNLTSQHPTLSEGRHNATFYAEDLAGNGGFATVRFTVDTSITTTTIYVFVSPQDPNDYILWDLVNEKWLFYINGVIVRCINATESLTGDCG